MPESPIQPPENSNQYAINFILMGARETNNTWNVTKSRSITGVSTATKAGEIYAKTTLVDSEGNYAWKAVPIVIEGIKYNKYYGYYFFGKKMYEKLNQNNIRNATVRLYNLENYYIYQSDPQGKTFVLYAHNYETYSSCNNVKNLDDKLVKIKEVQAPLEKSSIIDFVLTNEELALLKKYKGVSFSVIDKDNLTVHGTKCSIILSKGLNIIEPNEPEKPELPAPAPAENLILYEKGKHYSDTPFGTVNMLSSWNRQSDIYFETQPYDSLLWFSWNNNADISKYEYLEINVTNTVYHNTDLIVTRNSELDSLDKTTRKGYGHTANGGSITKHNMILEKTTEKISKGTKVTHKIALSKITQNGSNGFLHLYFYRKDYDYTAFTEIMQINSIKLIAKEQNTDNDGVSPVITDIWIGSVNTDNDGVVDYVNGKYILKGTTRADIYCYVNTGCGIDHIQYVNVGTNSKTTSGPAYANNPPTVYVAHTMYFTKGTTNTIQLTAFDKQGKRSITKTITIVMQ